VNPEQLGGDTPAAHELLYLDIASVKSTGRLAAPTAYQFANAPSRARRRVRSGDILVSTVRPYLRSFAQIRDAVPNLVASTGFAVIRPLDVVDSDFLYQHVLGDDFVEFLKPRMKGGNYPAVTGGDVASYPLVLPPPLEQRKIAAILSSVDDTIESSQAVIDQLQIVKRAMMAELLTKGLPGRHKKFKQTEIGLVPEEWALGTMNDLASFSGGNGFTPRDWSPHGLPIIRIQNLNGSLDFNYYAGAPEPDWLIEPGELLFAWAGSRGASFGPCLWPGPKGVLNQHIHRIAPRTNVRKHYLFSLLREITKRIEKRAHGFKDTLVHLRKGELTSWPVALPTLAEQDRIVDMLQEIDQRLSVEEELLACQRSTKSALMSVLLTGEIRVRVDEEAAA
jgi:type I restriction enzyme S subunit